MIPKSEVSLTCVPDADLSRAGLALTKPLSPKDSRSWVIRFDEDEPDIFAQSLSHQSSELVAALNRSSGRCPQTIEGFRMQYVGFTWRLFCFCRRAPDVRLEKLREIEKSLADRSADPFIRDTIASTSRSLVSPEPKWDTPSNILNGLLQLNQQTVVSASPASVLSGTGENSSSKGLAPVASSSSEGLDTPWPFHTEGHSESDEYNPAYAESSNGLTLVASSSPESDEYNPAYVESSNGSTPVASSSSKGFKGCWPFLYAENPSESKILKSPDWEPNDAGYIATELSKLSNNLWESVDFDELFQMASNQCSRSIEALKLQYIDLSLILFWRVRSRKENQLTILQNIEECLSKTADPFIIETIRCTYYSVTKGKWYAPKLQALSDLLTIPIEKLLYQHNTVIEHCIFRRILEIRFQRQFKGMDCTWELPLDTNFDLLRRVVRDDLAVLAKEISREDYAIYGNLRIKAFTQKSDPVKAELERRWDQQCHLFKECFLGGNGIDQRLSILAEELFKLRNFYSLTALLQGVQVRGMPTSFLRFSHLLDPIINYKAYRDGMEDSAALHWLMPAELLARHRINTAAKKVVAACARYEEILLQPLGSFSSATTAVTNRHPESPMGGIGYNVSNSSSTTIAIEDIDSTGWSTWLWSIFSCF